ncbi:hypothetical protein [Phaeodactylibacter xiamenensis]|uniref:hypothetical protein n=1 Tax=Phaeodactylibacter xiamenensis TaxID=1524460 RepID=UPI0024A8DBA3|nr:hypothetical protein [Phaeodactylibacter xiamenensis]
MRKAKSVARELVNNYTVGGGIFSLVPIPGIHSIGLTVAEAKLAADIAKIYGVKPYGLGWRAILQLIMTYCGGSAALKGLGEALNFVPIIGWAAKPLVATSVMKGFGEALIFYFEEEFPDHDAYESPSWKRMFLAFGNGMAWDEFVEYYEAYYGETISSTPQHS